jgi:hypothetical protein
MVKTIFESDASFKSYHEKMEEIRLDACQPACVSMCQPTLAAVRWNIQARGVVFMWQRTDFNSLNH